jgi:hypothetical protein
VYINSLSGGDRLDKGSGQRNHSGSGSGSDGRVAKYVGQFGWNVNAKGIIQDNIEASVVVAALASEMIPIFVAATLKKSVNEIETI